MGYECTAMGGDGRRFHDDSADDDEPLQSPSDDEESDSSDFVFADDSDEDFVFSDSDGTDTDDDSDDILSPVTGSDSDSDPDSDGTPVDSNADDESRDPSQPLSELDEGRFDSEPSRTEDTGNRGGESTGDEWGEKNSASRGPSSGSHASRRNDQRSGTDVPWRRDPSGGDRTDVSESEPDGSPSPDADRDVAAANDRIGTQEEPARAESTTPTKSDGGTLTETGEMPVPDPSVDDSLVPSGPSADQEMPLGEHIEEMVRRVLVVAAVMSIVAVLLFPFADRLINTIWYHILGAASKNVVQPRVYHPLALVLARLKVATLGGFVIALPVFVYETYRFMRPGLYPKERRYYLASIPTSLILAALGVAFAFFVVLPLIFIYFLGYSQGAAQIAFGLSDTFGLMLLLMGFFAVIFQIPLFIMLGVMMGVVTREWLADRRLYFWSAFFGIAFITNPDPTGMVPAIVTALMVVLFEGTLLVLKWTGRG
jgi:sec-independent protein translocase protein TatC